MTLIVLEGLSASGKSTIRDELLRRNPEWIKWKGENLMRKGPGDNWKEYQRRYHEALHRLYELNPENIIVADRAFSDFAYNSDPQFRQEMGRLYACYGNVHILYFTPCPWDDDTFFEADDKIREILQQRGSRDLPNAGHIRGRYKKLLQMFDHTMIDTGVEKLQSIKQAENAIMDVHNDTEHNPDI